MKGQVHKIEPFWKEDLATYAAKHEIPMAPHAVIHPNYAGTNLKQSFNEDVPNYKMFYEKLNVAEGSVCWLCLEPREIVPVHRDGFFMVRTKLDARTEDCIRYLIMLEDWKLGHVVQLDNWTLCNWKAGDTWYFDHEVTHWAANGSAENFYTCQVSALK
jgi:hypothetical protein